MNGKTLIRRSKKMNNDYFFFKDDDKAQEFYLKALGYGIWVAYEKEQYSGLYCVTIDKEKTWEAMYAKAKE